MTPADARRWLNSHYPTTILNDRYSGTYSKGEWIALPLSPEDVPPEIDEEDMVCQNFWRNYDGPVGRGRFPDDALDELEYYVREISKNKRK